VFELPVGHPHGSALLASLSDVYSWEVYMTVSLKQTDKTSRTPHARLLPRCPRLAAVGGTNGEAEHRAYLLAFVITRRYYRAESSRDRGAV
jgi:hypothetical protein